MVAIDDRCDTSLYSVLFFSCFLVCGRKSSGTIKNTLFSQSHNVLNAGGIPWHLDSASVGWALEQWKRCDGNLEMYLSESLRIFPSL